MKIKITKTLPVGCLLAFVLSFFACLPQLTNAADGTTITVGGMPSAIAITPNGEYAYVANTGSNTVSVVSTAVLNFPILKVIKRLFLGSIVLWRHQEKL
ncbi:MAG: hypothetical protein GX799_09475 [Crenarchaeota archaeon]|jgi:hypothetical protein|nr:hypothetical protein [Thermoproteota archaeon]